MEPSTDPKADGASGTDAPAARAIDRVLEAERQAKSTIAECEHSCKEQVERARQEGRAILARAEARIIALHTRAAKALEQRMAEAMEQARQSAATARDGFDDPKSRDAALERIVARLTGERRDGD